MKFNNLSNKLNIKLIKGNVNSILYINSEENLKIKPTGSSLKNKFIVRCCKLPSGILYFSSYVDFKAMNVILSDVKINKYKILGVKSGKLVNALNQLDMSRFFRI